jgi:WD domain, G-beta repeat
MAPKRWLRDCRPAPDGRSAFCFFDDGEMLRVELPSGKVLARKESPAARDPKRRYLCSAESRDGRLFAAGEHTEPPQRTTAQRMTDTRLEEWAELPPSEIHIWDTKLRPLATLTGHLGKINDLAFSPDGHWLLSGGTDGTVRVWDLSDLGPNANIGQN